jgi:pimeloyl-ACP methyl ester carboxylesterase
VYLHGVADNRSSAVGVIEHLTQRGFDVVAYDSRGHGQSDGEACTYGFYEKRDLKRVIESLPPGPAVLIGNSLGGAVAIQGAVGNERVAGVVAAEAFSDLRTIAIERAPRFLPALVISRAFRVAEELGRFDVADVSPVDAAASLRIPVLLIHGAADVDTPPDHSRRILVALAGPKQLLLVPGAGHNQSLNDPLAWSEIDRWLSAVVSR